jgi:lipopolysaccharide biosynthesis glycosyltransferase/exopolysaccharide biosynthesis predicted pyruvyltransferase EpsI
VCVISCWPEASKHGECRAYWEALGFEHVFVFVGRKPTGVSSEAAVADGVDVLECDDRWQGLPGKVCAAVLRVASLKLPGVTHILKVDDGLWPEAAPAEVLGMVDACVALGEAYVGFKTFHRTRRCFKSDYHAGVVDSDCPWFGRYYERPDQAPYWAGGRGYVVPLGAAARAAAAAGDADAEFLYEDAMMGEWMLAQAVPMLPAPEASPGLRGWCEEKTGACRRVRDMRVFLERTLGGCGEVIFIPNPGNAGDSLIALGCFEMLIAAQVRYRVGDAKETYDNETLVYAGAGNLVGCYPHCREFLRRNMHRGNRILLLPATVAREDELIATLAPEVTVLCREPRSYAYVYSTRKTCKHRVWLAEDMAFYIPSERFAEHAAAAAAAEGQRAPLLAFRTCQQEKPGYRLPRGNEDLSFTLERPDNTSDLEVVRQVCADMWRRVAAAGEVWTNRLHVAIAGALVGVPTHLFGSNYWKIGEIYEHSMRDRFPHVVWHSEDPPWALAPLNPGEERLHVAFCVDQKLAWTLPTVLHSIAAANGGDAVMVHVVHPDLTGSTCASLASWVHGLFPRGCIRFYEQGWPMQYRGADHISVATMLRLFLPELLQEAPRIVYLDVDLVVAGADLRELLRHPTGDTGFALRTSILTSHWIVSVFNDDDGVRRVGGNAGVLVMDLDLLRSRGFTRWACDYAADRAGERLTDQHIINEWCHGRHEPLAQRWNIFNPQEPQAPSQYVGGEAAGGCIVHYCGPKKPYGPGGSELPNYELWRRHRVLIGCAPPACDVAEADLCDVERRAAA